MALSLVIWLVCVMLFYPVHEMQIIDFELIIPLDLPRQLAIKKFKSHSISMKSQFLPQFERLIEIEKMKASL